MANDEEQIIGIISTGDIVKELIAEQAFIIDQLVNYITGDETKPPVPEKSEIIIS